jgi:hypothetical protein
LDFIKAKTKNSSIFKILSGFEPQMGVKTCFFVKNPLFSRVLAVFFRQTVDFFFIIGYNYIIESERTLFRSQKNNILKGIFS